MILRWAARRCNHRVPMDGRTLAPEKTPWSSSIQVIGFRIQISGEFDSLTYSAWVRIDGLDRPFIALMLTNGYEIGEPHWQLRNDGRLLLGIQTPEGHVAYDSKPVLSIKHLGRWTHLATVYDAELHQVIHYIDGESVGESPISTNDFKLRFNETEIGNWGTPTEYSPQKSATLTARSTN